MHTSSIDHSMTQKIMSFGGDDLASVVVHLGNSTCAMGFGGEEDPKCIFRSRVGRKPASESSAASKATSSTSTSTTSTTSTSSEKKYQHYVGVNQINVPREGMEIIHPIVQGEIVDWDACEAMWTAAFSDKLRIDISEHPVLHSEPPSSSSTQREKITQYMFEKYNVPAFFLVKDAVLTCFANARQTALVVDIGGGGVRITPVFDGYAMLQASLFSGLGGDVLTEKLLDSMRAKTELRPHYQVSRKAQKAASSTAAGAAAATDKEMQLQQQQQQLKAVVNSTNVTSSFHREMVWQLVEDVKASSFRVHQDGPWQPDQNQNIPNHQYELPDGSTFEVGPERFAIPELLFDPSPLTSTHFFPLQTLAQNAAAKCDVDIRRDLYGSVICSGATTMVSGLSKRLESELQQLLPSQMYKLRVLQNTFQSERRFAAWIGGSILASLGTFQQMWVSRAEYNESGSSIVRKKCP